MAGGGEGGKFGVGELEAGVDVVGVAEGDGGELDGEVAGAEEVAEEGGATFAAGKETGVGRDGLGHVFDGEQRGSGAEGGVVERVGGRNGEGGVEGWGVDGGGVDVREEDHGGALGRMEGRGGDELTG